MIVIHYTSTKGTHSNIMLNYTFLLQGCNIIIVLYTFILHYVNTSTILIIYTVLIIAYLCHSSAHLVVVLVVLYNYGI